MAKKFDPKALLSALGLDPEQESDFRAWLTGGSSPAAALTEGDNLQQAVTDRIAAQTGLEAQRSANRIAERGVIGDETRKTIQRLRNRGTNTPADFDTMPREPRPSAEWFSQRHGNLYPSVNIPAPGQTRDQADRSQFFQNLSETRLGRRPFTAGVRSPSEVASTVASEGGGVFQTPYGPVGSGTGAWKSSAFRGTGLDSTPIAPSLDPQLISDSPMMPPVGAPMLPTTGVMPAIAPTFEVMPRRRGVSMGTGTGEIARMMSRFRV